MNGKVVRYREAILTNLDEFDLPSDGAIVAGPFVHVISHVPGSWMTVVSWIERTFKHVEEVSE